MSLELRPTTPADLDYVAAIEADPEAAPWIVPWPRALHRRSLGDPAHDHLIVAEAGEPVGIVLIADLNHEHRSLELRRMVVAAPGRGTGRRVLALALDRCFEVHEAHRVWLDLKPENERARRAYEAVGFVYEATMRDVIRLDDAYEPLEVMSVLESEWAARRKIERFYRLFNAREIEALTELMRADVDWPNAFEGGRLLGRDAVRDYWARQFAVIDPRVEPLRVALREDGTVEVRVHQVVNDPSGDLIGQGQVLHRYRFDDAGLVARMDVVEVADEVMEAPSSVRGR